MMYYFSSLNSGSRNFKCLTSVTRRLTGLSQWDKELDITLKHDIENYWGDKLKNSNYDESDKTRDKYYVLPMFPYPSGHLHMGHVRVYTISDSVARFQRMRNKNVLHPIGWDAFGLPAENAAIERHIAADNWTKHNINHMKMQFQKLGCSFDWKHEISTCDPVYYKWTQYLFLKLFEAGLVYQKEALVNWDPIDQTVLADEQVDEHNKSWRSGAKVEKRLLKQWFIKTTQFAAELLDGLDDKTLQDWQDIIKIQKHWIGQCNGVSFDFNIVQDTCNILTDQVTFTVWTWLPEYIDHAKFVVVSKQHPFSKMYLREDISGVVKLPILLKNPLNEVQLPVFVSDAFEFLPDTDTHLGIPSVIETDKQFAIKQKIEYQDIHLLDNTEAKRRRQEICKKAQKMRVGGFWTSAKLKDWLISRQRYWGTPIPIVHCDKCGPQPVPVKHLPVTLPRLKTTVHEKGIPILSTYPEWLWVSCPRCDKPARRETDTMDTFVDSSWYYLRYVDPYNSDEMFSQEKAKWLMPVDLYIGGKEHATLHLYYARFISHFLNSINLMPQREPFKRLLVQGMVMGKSYRVKGTGQYIPFEQVKFLDEKKTKAIDVGSGQPIVIKWEKMSKSKHNGIDPSDMFQQYSVDTTRLLVLADVAPTSPRNWNSNTFPGILNWQRRLWFTIRDFLKHRRTPPSAIPDDQFSKHNEYMFDSRNFFVKETTFNYFLSQQMSVAISKMQGLTNSLRKMPGDVIARSLQFERALACQIILLAPMAPHFASELWSGFISAPNRLNSTGEILWNKTVLEQRWPEVDLSYNLDLTCQVFPGKWNRKRRY
ncbi:probable leucine--tRNA ligase, mitochondrial isoform X2 [Agrilus planipennis]|uniref:leucine--tRNA ligase n=1 Tax=Agrilus planipennis TaxID=224129 RepID=A0A1W4WN52_AGRPL|nr:probable leucine--tRNA ligase, mitochondrial isoform X2 [Agrilus planipennis]